MKNDFLKLLAQSKKLEKKKKLLRKEYPEEDKKLVKFLATIEENFHYSEKQEYITLAKDFLENRITAEEFSYSFQAIFEGISKQIGRLISDEPSELTNFLSKNRRSEFSRLLLRAYGSCESFSLDPEVTLSTEEELKEDAQNLLLILENKFSIKLDETQLNEIEDIYNANIEVFVTLEDGFPVTIIVGTPENLKSLMDKNNRNFYGPGLPWIIVQKLTKEIIYEAIEAYINTRPDSYWLKLYYFATDIDISVFDQLQSEEVKQSKKYEIIRGLDKLKDTIDKLAKLDQDSFKKEQSDILANLNELYQFLDTKPL